MDGFQAEIKALELLQRVQFPSHRLSAYPHQLSTGEKQRALIAMAFICDPEVVILDEPLASLDVLSQKKVLYPLLELLQGRAGLLVTHSLATAAQFSNRAAVLYGGTIVEAAPTQKLFSQPRHPYSRGLLRSYADMDRNKDLQGIRGKAEFVEKGCPFHPRCTQSLLVCQEKKPILQKIEDRKIACHRGGVIPLLTVKGLTKIVGSHKIIEGINQTLYEGETLAVIGAGGAGKTTLAKTVMGLIKATEGEIFLEKKGW